MNIKSYFKVLTEDDIEQHELKANQVFRKEQRLTEQVESVIGRKVESELVAVVERYNSHGVPMTNYILRCNLITLLFKHNKEVVLKRVDDGDLVFGKAWCTRFYQRNKLSLRAATTKMRDEIPADYEESIACIRRKHLSCSR
jgi:hypothetical protein